MNTTLILIISAAVVVFMIGAYLVSRYKRCPSDQLLVVYGKVGQKSDGSGETSSAKVLQGGGALIWPVIQDYAFLSLNPIPIDIKLHDALSKQNIRIAVPSTVTVAVSRDPRIRVNAAERILGLQTGEIADLARDIIFGQLRQVIAQMTIEEINANRDTFLANISKGLEKELHKIGLDLVNVNVTDIKDESGYIVALGQKAASEALNNANVEVAENDKVGEIGVATANREKRITTAQLTSEAEVGEAKSSAEAEIGSKDAESKQRIETSALNAKAIEGENIAAVEIANTTAERDVAEAEAKRKAVTAQRVKSAQAEKDSYAAQKEAELARAERVEATQKADVIVPAKIEQEKIEIDADAEANKIRKIAQGKADAKFAEMEALARGDYERLAKQAEGFESIVKAAGGDPDKAVQLMIADKLEDLMRIQVDAISNLKIDSITVWDQGSGNGNGQGSTAGFLKDVLNFVPGFEEVYKMAGKELPSILQGAGTKEAAKLNANKAATAEEAVDVDYTEDSQENTESTEE